MSFKIDNRFFILVLKGEKDREITLFGELRPAVTQIREYLTKNVEPQNIELNDVEVDAEANLKIRAVPWDMIAAELVKLSNS